MITLYHGSDVEINEIDVRQGMPDKDFGQGFYLTSIQKQAERMAVSRCQRHSSSTPVVTVFDFNEELARKQKLRIKVFNKPTQAWARFVLNNRKASLTGFSHDFDIVIGPVADDTVATQLRLYELQYITLRQLVMKLTYHKVNNQYFFANDNAVRFLSKKGVILL